MNSGLHKAAPILTNHHWRGFKREHEVPQRVLNEYDHLGEDARYDGWICYRGYWSHISDYTPTPSGCFAPKWLTKWDLYKPDGFTSGVVIRWDPEGEFFQIGTYC